MQTASYMQRFPRKIQVGDHVCWSNGEAKGSGEVIAIEGESLTLEWWYHSDSKVPFESRAQVKLSECYNPVFIDLSNP